MREQCRSRLLPQCTTPGAVCSMNSRPKAGMQAVWLFPLLLALALATGCGPGMSAEVDDSSLPERVDYNFHVKPILADRCYPCHGPDENARMTEFRLDSEEGASVRLGASRRRHALVPGSLRKSELAHRIASSDPDFQMPPPESNLSVTPQEVAMIFKWIQQGAEFKPHWSLIPPVKPGLPEVAAAEWPANGIDHFVLRRLESEGLLPAPRASREALIRRVTFDLTGLPPTIEEMDAFLADESGDAYERVVDRLLSSDAYGERMATEWLDVARYADSHGFQDDGLRRMWPWRDWVIESFNENQPFDEFVTWQLAGDLLPTPTIEQRLATGFNRNHLQSQEGGIIPEEYRVEYVADRTNTFGKAFLGLTLECARCHDHKFDPVSQREYYQLFDFFNSVNEFGTSPYSGVASPSVILIDEDAEQQLSRLNSRIDSLEKQTAVANTAFDTGFDDWLADFNAGRASVTPKGLIGHYPLDRLDAAEDESGERTYYLENRVQPEKRGLFVGDTDKLPLAAPGRLDSALAMQGDGYLDMGGDLYYFERNQPFSIGLWIKLTGSLAERPLFAKTTGLFNGRQGYLCVMEADGTVSASLNHVFPDNSIRIRSIKPLPVGAWAHVMMTYDGSSRASGLSLYLNGRRMESRTVVDNLKQSIMFTINPTTGEPTTPPQAGNLRIGYMGPTAPTVDSVAVDQFQVYDRSLTALEVAAVHGAGELTEAGLASWSGGSAADRMGALRSYYVTAVSSTYKRDFEKLTDVRGQENDIISMLPEVMAMKDLPEPRPTHVLDRGLYDAPGERVSRATPEAIMPFPEGLPKNRLGLARWLTSSGNPLMARVTVNRYWQMYFGNALVGTPDDFGSQGGLPTHPELLDWLAVTFVETDWDVKALQRLIVTSSAYRQSSVAGPALLERDPGNELLARGPSYRWPAEMIRDNALAIGGILVDSIGGPPVKPYQPEGLWKELATRNATSYEQGQGEDLYRRSMYTIWKRTSPPPSMITFDAPERNTCTVERQATSTPLQALVLLNDPQYVEAARVLAARLLRDESAGIAAQLTRGYRLLTSQFPDEDMLGLLTDHYESEEASFGADRESALEVAGVGEYPTEEGRDPVRLAALTVVLSTVMNFDAAVMKR